MSYLVTLELALSITISIDRREKSDAIDEAYRVVSEKYPEALVMQHSVMRNDVRPARDTLDTNHGDGRDE